jgi:diguanylate cyclase (GGDEF)-like protein
MVAAAQLIVFIAAGVMLCSLLYKIYRMKESRRTVLALMGTCAMVLLAVSFTCFIFDHNQVRESFQLLYTLLLVQLFLRLLLLLALCYFIFEYFEFNSFSTRLLYAFIAVCVAVTCCILLFIPLNSSNLSDFVLWWYNSGPVRVNLNSKLWSIVYLACTGFMLLTAILLLSVKIVKAPALYRKKYLYILCDLVVLSAGDLLYVYKVIPQQFCYHNIFWFLLPVLLYNSFFRHSSGAGNSMFRRLVFDRLGSPILLFDVNDYLIDLNTAAADLFSISVKHPADYKLADFLRIQAGGQIRRRSASCVEEIHLRTEDGKPRTYKLDYTWLKDTAGKFLGTLLVFQDITEMKKMYDNIEHVAMTDQLTGLASKYMLDRKITEINLYRNYPYCAAVCNINGLKIINDGFGKTYGNLAITKVAEVIRSTLRTGDFAASDLSDMVLLMPDTTVENAHRIFSRIAGKLEKEHSLPFVVSIEYGVAERISPDTDMHEALDRAKVAMLSKKTASSIAVHENILRSLQLALSNTEYEAGEHIKRLQLYAEKTGKILGLTEDVQQKLMLLASFHDIGEYSISDTILLSTEELLAKERDEIRMHTIRGCSIAKSVPSLVPVADAILSHHEWWNGQGYPNGIKGDKIPFIARIISVADAYDAMTHDRPYRAAVTNDQAVTEIKKGSGTQFDPAVVEAFLTAAGNDWK